jgi:hypothetical protein
MDIGMVHMIKIFVLYVGIAAAIQEHTYDHCRGNVSGPVYIYLNPLGHTLKIFASLEYGFCMRSKREGGSKSGLRKYRNGSERVQNPCDDIMEVSEWKKVNLIYLWKVRNTPERETPGGAHGP